MPHCNALQHTATHYNTLLSTWSFRVSRVRSVTTSCQHLQTRDAALQLTTTHCSSLQHTGTQLCFLRTIMSRPTHTRPTQTGREQGDTLQHTATHCNTLPATHCNSLQQTATHCNRILQISTDCSTLQHCLHVPAFHRAPPLTSYF